MDKFDKRAIFYILLIFGIVFFFMFFYWDGIYRWNKVYEEAQRSIRTSKLILNNINNNERIYDYYLAYHIKEGIEWQTKYKSWQYLICTEIDSPIFIQDTIIIIKNFLKHSDTIKIALEDL